MCFEKLDLVPGASFAGTQSGYRGGCRAFLQGACLGSARLKEVRCRRHHQPSNQQIGKHFVLAKVDIKVDNLLK
jgi:hypothetical protein